MHLNLLKRPIHPEAEPLNRQIYQQIKALIQEGALSNGDALPSTRLFAKDHHISRNVVNMAYEQLALEGYIGLRPRAGAFVIARPTLQTRCQPQTQQVASQHPLKERSVPQASEFAQRMVALEAERPIRWQPTNSEFEIDFRAGVPPFDEMLPVVLKKAAVQTLHQFGPNHIHYGEPAGDAELRQELQRYLYRARGIQCSPEQILITHGAQQAFQLIAQAFLNPSDRVLTEDPGYKGFTRIMTNFGADVVGIPVDDAGLRTEYLPETDEFKLAYVTPSHQFPTGSILSWNRRQQLLEWSVRNGAYIVEDDYDSEFQYDLNPIPALHSMDFEERVIYVGTLSKIIAPSLRLGYMVIPTHLLSIFNLLKKYADNGESYLLQHIFLKFIQQGNFERYIRKMRNYVARKRTCFLSTLEKNSSLTLRYSPIKAGLHIMLECPTIGGDSFRELKRDLNQKNIQIYDANVFYEEAPKHLNLLLGYGHLSEQDIEKGVTALAISLDALNQFPNAEPYLDRL